MATITTVIGSLSFYKIFSFYLGPPGVALLAHIQNMLSIATTLPHEGVNKGTIKYLSGKVFSDVDYTTYFYSSCFLQLVIYFLSLPVLYILIQHAEDLPVFVRSNEFVVLFFLAVLFQMAVLFLFSLLLSSEKFKAYALFSMFNSIAGVSLLFVCIRHHAAFALIALLFSPTLVGILLFIYVSKMLKNSVVFNRSMVNAPAIRDISQFLLIACCTLFFGRMVDYFVRVYILSKFELYQTGLWQSAVKLSDGYTSLFSGVLGVVFYPKMAAIINNKGEIKTFFLKISATVVPMLLLGLFLVFLFKSYFLRYIFNESFVPAGTFLDYQIAGDAFKLISWLMVYLVLARAEIKIYMAIEFLSALIYIPLVYIFSNSEGVVGVTHAHVWRYIAYFCLLMALTIRFYLKPSYPDQVEEASS